MSMTDPIADMLTRIRNAQKARKQFVSIPASRLKLAIVEVLKLEGYVDSVESEEDGVRRSIRVGLKYHKSEPVIERIERVSRPGLRVYSAASDLPRVQGGLGVAIVSTSGGVMTDRQARAQGRGGEVLCIVS
ncbi:MAG TPA: 30S ribosomal protein S8 [Gammaproteobacteria bacterium]|nr:30S ribosomal protein S8 [Gammaproteobacteria bacterium]